MQSGRDASRACSF